MKYKFTLSVKLTAIFTILIFISVLVFSLLILTFTRKSSEYQQTEELHRFLSVVEVGYGNDVREGVAFPSHAIPYYILYRISQIDGSLIRTNDAQIPVLPDTPSGKAANEFRENFFIDGDLNLLYVAKTVYSPTAGDFRVQVALDLHQDNAHLILKGMQKVFLIYTLPLLLFSSFIAFFVSRRILHPLRKIIFQAKEITSEKLDSRLDESGPRDELQELAVTFNQLFSHLQEEFDKQRRFTCDAAHELKTPLAVISGHVDLLCRWGKNNPQVLDESLLTLQKESRSMKNLIENLLELTRAESSKVAYSKESIALKDFLQEIVADFQIIYPDVNFTVSCPSHREISCNREALRQILRIFTKNSIIYSDQPASVTLQWQEEKHELLIQDRGWGIGATDVGRVFDRFYRVDESRNRSSGGTGLGLPIAKALIEGLGLNLDVQSVVGEGTTMILKFPH